MIDVVGIAFLGILFLGIPFLVIPSLGIPFLVIPLLSWFSFSISRSRLLALGFFFLDCCPRLPFLKSFFHAFLSSDFLEFVLLASSNWDRFSQVSIYRDSLFRAFHYLVLLFWNSLLVIHSLSILSKTSFSRNCSLGILSSWDSLSRGCHSWNFLSRDSLSRGFL